jgi:pyruvate/2-oxoglutarate dehydrogenase complex dihydrolipoamide acyltransferase (E2) component
MSILIKVPTLPHASPEARVGHSYYQPGDMVPRDAILVELWVQGQSVPVIAHQAGLLERMLFPEGAMVSAGAVIAHLKLGLPNLLWDPDQGTLIRDTYHAAGVTASMEYDVRQKRRQGQQKFGKGVGNSLALPQSENAQQEYGEGLESAARQRFKPHPELKDSSQFAGDPNPRNTTIPSDPVAQRAPQNAPTLNPKPGPAPAPAAPTPKPQ